MKQKAFFIVSTRNLQAISLTVNIEVHLTDSRLLIRTLTEYDTLII